jgi:hypothetical protein
MNPRAFGFGSGLWVLPDSRSRHASPAAVMQGGVLGVHRTRSLGTRLPPTMAGQRASPPWHVPSHLSAVIEHLQSLLDTLA